MIREVLSTAFRQQLELRGSQLDDAPSRLVEPVEARVETGIAAGVETSEAAVGETHVYQLPARISLEPGVPVATALFPRSAAPRATSTPPISLWPSPTRKRKS